MNIPEFKPGDRVLLPSGRTGTVCEPPWEMPLHELIELDGGGKSWMLRELLASAPIAPPPTSPSRSKRRKAIA